MQTKEIRKKFLDFFGKRDHKIVPSSLLIPDDPSVLLTTAGVQQFKKYYTGEADPMKDFGSKNTASIQKSFRTSDIDEVGDESHLTFFEMLGNFSFGGYFKKETIKYAHEFITKEMNLPISYVTVFKGSESVPKDEESRAIWNALGINDVREEGMKDVFWGPTGNSGPCGPTTEIYCKNKSGKDIEVWNCVFNQFFFPGSREELEARIEGKKLEPLKIAGVDTGMGLERLVMVSQGVGNIFETDLFLPIMDNLSGDLGIREKRIVADHLRGTVFLLADGVRPSNKEAGYVLRRLMRRAMVYGKKISSGDFEKVINEVIKNYSHFYPELEKSVGNIREKFGREREKFGQTLEKGVRELDGLKNNMIDAKIAFGLYETFGLPYEIIKELGGDKASTLTRKDFDEEFRKHQEISRAGLEKKFGGHGLILDTGELRAGDERELKIVTRLHTATHLLNAALRKVLGPDIQQQGSDINVGRTRFDFTFPRKLTPEEIKKIEDWVREAIARDLTAEFKQMPYEEAIAGGAVRFWREKYPATVKVYTVYDPKTGEIFSRELCGGPHVNSTGEIGNFKIAKEESSSAGVRRIRGVIQ